MGDISEAESAGMAGELEKLPWWKGIRDDLRFFMGSAAKQNN